MFVRTELVRYSTHENPEYDMTLYKIGKLEVPRYKYAVVMLAQSLHESTSCSTDPLSSNDGLFIYEFLKVRLNDWLDSDKIFYKYDFAVKSLLKAAIEEYEKHDKVLDEEWMRSNGKELDWIEV